MSKLVSLPGPEATETLNWFATGGLFDDVAAFILQHIRDERAKQEVTAGAASGHLFLGDLPESVLQDVLLALRDELPGYVNSAIYPPSRTSAMDYPEIFIARAKSLAHMAGNSIAQREGTQGASELGEQNPTVVATRSEPGIPLRGQPLYQDPGDIDFLCDTDCRAEKLSRAGADGSTSIRIGTVCLEVGITTQQLLYVHGYSPRSSWQSARFEDQRMAPGEVFVVPDKPFVPGVPVVLGQRDSWRTEYDERSGWLRIAAAGETEGVVTLIADDTGVGMYDECLVSVWLRFQQHR
ncbi:hypothetical protein AB0I49_13160 [Streptomyces sp. NPDC050617]|uniref:hypothetical protein n=1 Tax=Streptomyces sp. NPDC050617 TaxID=3154628 RepID=UPI003438F332